MPKFSLSDVDVDEVYQTNGDCDSDAGCTITVPAIEAYNGGLAGVTD